MKKGPKFIILIISFVILSKLGYPISFNPMEVFEEFKNQFNQNYVSPFNKDITGVVCANVFNRGDSLGLFTAVPPSIGLNLKVNLTTKQISKDNIILNELFKDQNFKIIPFFALQVEKGLPFNIDLIGRYSGYSDFSFFSVGVKYRFLSLPPLVPVVNFSLAGLYNSLKVKEIFVHTSQSLNLIVSVDKVPFIKPYVVIGLDTAQMKVDDNVIPGGMTNRLSSGMRYELGLNLSFIPFLYFNLGYSLIYGDPGYSFNLGAKF